MQGFCDGLGMPENATNVNVLKAGCSACNALFRKQDRLEKKFDREILLTDYSNNTYRNYLKMFLDPSWVEQQSFCMSGLENSKLVETLPLYAALCYTINGLDGIYNEKK